MMLGRRFTAMALRRWRPLTAALATMVAEVAVNLARPWPLKILVDNALRGDRLRGTAGRLAALLPGAGTRDGLLNWCVAATVVVFMLGWLVDLSRRYTEVAFGQRLAYDLAGDLYAQLVRLSLRFHHAAGTGDTVRRVSNDSTCISTIVVGAVLPGLTGVITLVAVFAVMVRLDATLALLALAAVPVMALALRRYSGPMLERSYAQHTAEGEMYNTVEQALSAMPIIKAFGLESDADRRLAGDTSRILDATVAATAVQFRFKILAGSATALGTAAILWIGGRHALADHLSVGTIVVFLTYLTSLYGPLSSLVYANTTVQDARASARRVLEVLEAEPEVPRAVHPVVLDRPVGAVRFESVGFAYQPDRPVLCDIDLDVAPGTSVAIVGPTGAGKSTLVSLLPRFYDPTAGRILLDGHDLRQLDLASLRPAIGIVLQEPFLFPRSIADNIAYGRPGATFDQIKAAADAAHASEFISRLPAGYETVLGEGGATLSGGQRQRLAIARALLKDPAVLILDEPTSALDAETEALVLDALSRLMAGRTSFVIAHRLSTIRRADTIVVLRDGVVCETGTHSQLLRRRHGTYANLHRLQTGTARGR